MKVDPIKRTVTDGVTIALSADEARTLLNYIGSVCSGGFAHELHMRLQNALRTGD